MTSAAPSLFIAQTKSPVSEETGPFYTVALLPTKRRQRYGATITVITHAHHLLVKKMAGGLHHYEIVNDGRDYDTGSGACQLAGWYF